ncbi:hypothetical protein [Rhizobium sullae]|uniref:hypothetical protein n=1 Tax=Rhizobium sullae TaxID=50338 RepID=UPI001A9EB4F1|nr:hypothetical protein [Rhizobium sullae]
MLEEVSLPDRGGALHLSKVLPAEDMKLLLSLPFPRPESGEVIEANFQIARCFFPRARALAEKLNIPWPISFEAATRQMLTAEFGTEYPIDWQ